MNLGFSWMETPLSVRNMAALLHCYCLAPEVAAALQLSLKQQISQRGLVLHQLLATLDDQGVVMRVGLHIRWDGIFKLGL